MSGSSPLYAAVDLGSNSFHMLVVRNVEGAVRAVARVKRKVRLASGLDSKMILSREAIERGLDCLRLFADQLSEIPESNIRIVGTATLRLAKNSDEFVKAAEEILGHHVEIISGEIEAKTIYHGVLSTFGNTGSLLVVDIGGASTELIAGYGTDIKVIHSLGMGCVTWLKRYFTDNLVNEKNYSAAIEAARDLIIPFREEYRSAGFESCLGASGTVQALHEYMLASGKSENITLNDLEELKKLTILQGFIDSLNVPGLTKEMLAVFPSGLSVLIAVFEVLEINSITLSGGALREGIISTMLGGSVIGTDNRLRTTNSLITRYQLDRWQSERVAKISNDIFKAVAAAWKLDDASCIPVLKAAARLYEIGLCIEYKKAPQHAAYIVDNIDMPGFTAAQKHLLSALLANERDDYKLELLQKQNAVGYRTAAGLARILRTAVILCARRTDEIFKEHITFRGNPYGMIRICVPHGWCRWHYLIMTLLSEETARQSEMGWQMEVIEE